jgi:hypothetical protein
VGSLVVVDGVVEEDGCLECGKAWCWVGRWWMDGGGGGGKGDSHVHLHYLMMDDVLGLIQGGDRIC